MAIDLAFNLSATRPVPSDHGYLLYSAVSRMLPAAHQTNGIAIHPIRGQIIGDRQLLLDDRSRLIIRTAADRIAQWLPLAGKQLNLAGNTLRVGVPQVLPLSLATALRSRLVTIKVSPGERAAPARTPTEEEFRAAARRQLDTLGVDAAAELMLGKRRTLRIKQREVVGYEVLVSGLSAEESLRLQEAGLGGRRHMGCGVFVPVVPRRIENP